MQAPSTVADFSRDLATLVRMGMPMADALRFLGREDASPSVRKAAHAMASLVETGASLGIAVQASPFPRFFGLMAAFGEQAERLPDILERLADYFDVVSRVRARAREALLYPTAVLLSCVVVALIMWLTMQAFTPIEQIWHASYGFERALYFLLGAAAVAIAVVLVLPTAGGDWLRWHLPYARSVWRDSSFVLLCRGVALALESGSTLPDALRMAETAETNTAARQALASVRVDVEKGLPLSAALQVSGAYPASIVEAALLGEHGEDLPKALLSAADMSERMLEWKTSAVMAWLEPAALVAVGGIVFFVIQSFWVPFYNWAGYMIP